MSCILYSAGIRQSIITIIRTEVENYFEINLKGPIIYRHTPKRLNKIPLLDGLKLKRGKARQFFYYLVSYYGAFSSIEIGKILNVPAPTVRSTLRNFKGRTPEEEKIISDLVRTIGPRILRSCTPCE